MKWILILYTIHVVQAAPRPGSNFIDSWVNPDNPIKIGTFENSEDCNKALAEMYELNFSPKESDLKWRIKGICIRGNYP